MAHGFVPTLAEPQHIIYVRRMYNNIWPRVRAEFVHARAAECAPKFNLLGPPRQQQCYAPRLINTRVRELHALRRAHACVHCVKYFRWLIGGLEWCTMPTRCRPCCTTLPLRQYVFSRKIESECELCDGACRIPRKSNNGDRILHSTGRADPIANYV